jgi:hypothetical protein
VEAALEFRGHTALDFDSTGFGVAWQAQQQVNFVSDGTTIEISLDTLRCSGNQRFDDQPFSAAAGDGMGKQRLVMQKGVRVI